MGEGETLRYRHCMGQNQTSTTKPEAEGGKRSSSRGASSIECNGSVVFNDSCRECSVVNYSTAYSTHRLDVFFQTGEAEVVDDVPGANQERDPVALQ